MADQFIQIPPQSTGLKVDCTELTVGANTVERERHNIADPTDAAGLAKVLSSAPAGTEYAVLTRNIPSGTQAVSGTVTTTPPAHASTDVDRLNGTTVDTNSGTKSAGTLRVVLATDQPALTNKLLVTADPITFASAQAVTEATLDAALIAQEATTSGVKGIEVFGAVTTNAPTYVTAKSDALSLDTSGLLRVSLKDTPANTNKFLVTPDSVALPLHQSVNLDQLNGTAPDVNSGVKSAGTLRVILATDQPQLTNKLLVTPDANSAVNVAQINGVAPLMGNGATGTGSQRVTIASDNTAFSVNVASDVPGTGATNTGKAEDAAHTTGDTGVMVLGVRESTPTDLSGNAANGDYEPFQVGAKGGLWVSGIAEAQGGWSIATGSIAATKTDIGTANTAGQVGGWYIYNSNATVAYVQFFNAQASAVTLGTTAPVYSLGIPATSAANVAPGMVGLSHSTAISIAITTTRAGLTGTGSTVDYNIWFKQ